MHYSASSHSLFAQLQSRFPTSSLITELVQTQDGQYVVRALVQIGGTVLTTGMAAAATVEQAEDAARLRVLGVLGILPEAGVSALPDIPSLLNGAPLPNPSFEPAPQFPSSPQATRADVKPEPAPISPSYQPLEDLPFASPDTLTAPLEPVVEALEEFPEEFSNGYDEVAEYEAAEFAPPIAEPDPVTAPTRSSVTPLPSRPAPPKPEPAIAPEVEEPEDLSFLIAQTDIEMDRIGWTKQEGRDYLKRTYKKSTRQKLEVDELMDFLNYLRALPSVNGL